MDKEKEIEEMARDIGDVLAVTYEGDSFPFTMHTRFYLSKALIKAGYRKADEVRKKTAKEIWGCFKGYKKEFRIIEWGMIKRIFQEYGVEVDE